MTDTDECEKTRAERIEEAREEFLRGEQRDDRLLMVFLATTLFISLVAYAIQSGMTLADFPFVPTGPLIPWWWFA